MLMKQHHWHLIFSIKFNHLNGTNILQKVTDFSSYAVVT